MTQCLARFFFCTEFAFLNKCKYFLYSLLDFVQVASAIPPLRAFVGSPNPFTSWSIYLTRVFPLLANKLMDY